MRALISLCISRMQIRHQRCPRLEIFVKKSFIPPSEWWIIPSKGGVLMQSIDAIRATLVPVFRENDVNRAVLVVAVAGVLYVTGRIMVTLDVGTAIGTAISSLCTTVDTCLGTIFAFA